MENALFFTLKLNNLIARTLFLILVLAVCTGLSWLVFSNFIVRVFADSRLSFSNELLAAAALRFPDSPRIRFRLAETEMAEAVGQVELARDALTHAKRSVDLCFWDYRYSRILGLLQEMNGDPSSAETTLRIASGLAPNHSEVNWALANVLLRRGKLDQALPSFRTATKNREDLVPITFELVWKASGNSPGTLKRLAENNPQLQLSLVQYFLDQSMTEDALSVFNSVSLEARAGSTKSDSFLRSLIQSGNLQTARMLWLDLVSGGRSSGNGNLIWNGSFERGLEKDFQQFEWAIASNEFARVGLDTQYAHSGSRSVKFAFTGRDTTTLRGELRQLTALTPGRRYRLECFARAYDLITTEGPRLAIMDNRDALATSEPVQICNTEWQHLTVEFTAPADVRPFYAAIVRIPKFSYDDPTRGSIWFDDFTLVELQQAASNP